MSEHYRPVLAPLPLLLWRPPPGLELILAQEGVPYETLREAHPFAFRRGRFVLADGAAAIAGLRKLITHAHVVINLDIYRADQPIDPFQALIDTQSAPAVWTVKRWNLRERVARHPKAWIRRRLIDALREHVLAAGGCWIRLAPFPHPFRSVFTLRVDLDEHLPDDYHRFALPRNLLADCTTHFLNTHAYENQPEVLADLRDHDTQSHGHFHYVYRDPEANRRNLERAHRVLCHSGFTPSGFAAPHGRWNHGLDDAIEALGYEYSSDFQLGYDDLPYFPWKGERFSRVLQVPVHPVCEGLFLDAGVEDRRLIADYFARVVEAKVRAGEPALVYGHPERRLGRMPEVLIGLHRVLDRQSLLWRATMTELARWWRWRSERRFVVLPREGRRLEVQFEEWDPQYPLALEVQRGEFSASLPLSGPRTILSPDELAYERRASTPALAAPRPDRRPVSLKDAVRQALDWETVTPLDELPSVSLSGRLKKGLRWWKLQRTGTG
jgi:hypothetical protein